MVLFFACFSAVALCACSSAVGSQATEGSTQQSREVVYWVNNSKADCVGVGPMKCLQIQRGEKFNPDAWQLFYGGIEGFVYQPGNIYKLLVKEERIQFVQRPADVSSIRYSLVRILDEKVDVVLRLNDIWALEEIGAQKVCLTDGLQRPVLEINTREMRVLGNDGCNDFSGIIKNVDSNTILLGPVVATRRRCTEMLLSDQIHEKLLDLHSYAIKGLRLFLYDSKGNQLMVFKKVD